jgi:hypothetical protein
MGTPEHASSLGHDGFWVTSALSAGRDPAASSGGEPLLCTSSCHHGPTDIDIPHWSCCGNVTEEFKCVAGVKHKWHAHKLVEMTKLNVVLGAAEVDPDNADGNTVFCNIKKLDGVKNPGALVVLQPSQLAMDRGLEAGDTIIACNGLDVDGMVVPEFATIFFGEIKEQGQVTLTVLVQRGGGGGGGKQGAKKIKYANGLVAWQQEHPLAENTMVVVTDREKVREFANDAAKELQVDEYKAYVEPEKELVIDGALGTVLGKLPSDLCAVSVGDRGLSQVAIVHAHGLRVLSKNKRTFVDKDLPTFVAYVGYDGSHPVYKVTLSNGDGTEHTVIKRFKEFRALNEKVAAINKKAKKPVTLVSPFPASSLKSKFSLLGGLMSKAELSQRAHLLWNWLSELRWLGRRELVLGWEVHAALNDFLNRPTDEALLAKANKWSEEEALQSPAIYDPEVQHHTAVEDGAHAKQVSAMLATLPPKTCFDKTFLLSGDNELGFVVEDEGMYLLPTVKNYNPSRVWPSTGDQVVAVNGEPIVINAKDNPVDQAVYKILTMSEGGKEVKITFGYSRSWTCAGCAAPGSCRGRSGGGNRHLCVDGCEFDLCQSCMDMGDNAAPLFSVGETLRLCATDGKDSTTSSLSDAAKAVLASEGGGAVAAAGAAAAGGGGGVLVVVDGAVDDTVLACGVRWKNNLLARLEGSSAPPEQSTGLHPWHKHPITRVTRSSSSVKGKSWSCDGYFFPGSCRGGAHKVPYDSDPFWECAACDFMLCESCWRMGQLAPLPCNPGDIVKVGGTKKEPRHSIMFLSSSFSFSFSLFLHTSRPRL